MVALHDPADQFHGEARTLFAARASTAWVALDVTAHESYTRSRYRLDYVAAIEHYRFLRQNTRIELLRFRAEDEDEAEAILSRYAEHALSFHDALCAAAMKRIGIFQIFTFDRDFAILGFALLPGQMRL